MLSTKHETVRLVAACAAVVAAIGLTAPAIAADEPDREHEKSRVIVPRGPGEDARTFSGQSPLVRDLARRSARSEQANAADRRFVRHMIPHHYQAILMSRLAPERFGDRRIRSMAERIRGEQVVEIDGMRNWQGREGLPKTRPKRAYHHMLHDPEMVEHMGMATAAEMETLRNKHGRAFDRLFLRLMIPHHNAAIRMAENVAGEGNDLFIRQFAIDMMSSQARQVHDMRQIRKSW